MSKEFKVFAYYYARRSLFDQLLYLCEDQLNKKVKDPIVLFWRAFAVGMNGDVNESLKQLEVFQSRKDIQLPITVALWFMHKQNSSVDHEAVSSLEMEIPIAEDLAKEAGLSLATRFAMIIGEYDMATRFFSKMDLEIVSTQQATPIEIDAWCADNWSSFYMATSWNDDIANSGGSVGSIRKIVRKIENVVNGRVDICDVDTAMLWAQCKVKLGNVDEAIDIYNQVIAVNPWYIPALTEKLLAQLLQLQADWEPILDTAQRLLDEDRDHIDALFIVVIHAFTQDGDINEAIIKLDELKQVLLRICPHAIKLIYTISLIVSQICSRNTRALQVCVDILERLVTTITDKGVQTQIFTLIGQIKLFQGPHMISQATQAYQDAIKRDDTSSVAPLLGLVRCQLMEGDIDDAEAQLDLLTAMHEVEELGVEYTQLKALILRIKSGGSNASDEQKAEHIQLLNECREVILPHSNNINTTNSASTLIDAKYECQCQQNPDQIFSLAMEYLVYAESYTPVTVYLTNPATANTSNMPNNPSENKGNTLPSLPKMSGQTIMATQAQLQTMLGPLSTTTTFNTKKEKRNKQKNSGNTDVAMNSDSVEISPTVLIGINLLKYVLQSCPGFLTVYIEIARALACVGRTDEAVRTLHQCLNLHPRSTSALLMKARIEAARSQAQAAEKCLEQALSHDFSIRSCLLYRLIYTHVWSLQDKYEEAITELKQLVALPEIRIHGPSVDISYADSLRVTDEDRVNTYILLGYLYGRTKRLKEAKHIFTEAKNVFDKTSQGSILLLASAQFSADRKDFDTAIKMLDNISSDYGIIYNRAQLIKAEILLMSLQDRDGYIKCYEQLIDHDPSVKNYIALGEACLKILRPEAAVTAFEKAYNKDRSNIKLRGRIGRILITIHEYFRAMEYYEAAIREAGSTDNDAITLSHDLARLLLKLGRGEASARVLMRAVHESPTDITDMKNDVATLLLLSEVSQTLKRDEKEIIDIIMRAYTLQKQVLVKIREGSSAVYSTDMIDKERHILADICTKLGTIYFTQFISGSNNNNNINNSNSKDSPTSPPIRIEDIEPYFNEAISHESTNIDGLMGLAKLQYHTKEYEKTQTWCKKVLLDDPSYEEAAILLSEAKFKNNEMDTSLEPLITLLKQYPCNYHALARFILLSRRAGSLPDVVTYLTEAEKNDTQSKSNPGYIFCQGLYARYTNDISKAIYQFNKLRRDSVWGEQALIHMIELYLNPDQQGVWDSQTDPSAAGASHIDETTSEHLAVAQSLLSELQPICKDKLRYDILECHCCLATRQRSMIDKAMQKYEAILDKDPDYLPAILGMATGFMIEKSEHKARNLLKRVGSIDTSTTNMSSSTGGSHSSSGYEGEDYTTATLLLAKFYIDQGKFPLAQDLCKKCLTHNKSCSQAWELLGLSMEKEQDYGQAADCFQKAWKLEFEASAPIGFKLAFCYLKSHKYTECIDICETVLKQYPDYPSIKEEIVKKALMSLRG